MMNFVNSTKPKKIDIDSFCFFYEQFIVLFRSLRKWKRHNKRNFTLKSNLNRIMLFFWGGGGGAFLSIFINF